MKLQTQSVLNTISPTSKTLKTEPNLSNLPPFYHEDEKPNKGLSFLPFPNNYYPQYSNRDNNKQQPQQEQIATSNNNQRNKETERREEAVPKGKASSRKGSC